MYETRLQNMDVQLSLYKIKCDKKHPPWYIQVDPYAYNIDKDAFYPSSGASSSSNPWVRGRDRQSND